MSSIDEFLKYFDNQNGSDDFEQSILANDTPSQGSWDNSTSSFSTKTSSSSSSSSSSSEINDPEQKYNETLTLHHVLSQLQELQTKVEQQGLQISHLLNIIETNPNLKKRKHTTEKEKVIKDCITQFLQHWKISFRCANYYRSRCESPFCTRIHDKSSDSELAREIRSLLLQTKSDFFQSLIAKLKNRPCHDAVTKMCDELTSIKQKFDNFQRDEE